MRACLLAAFLSPFTPFALAEDGEQYVDAFTIRAADAPSDAPRFDHYPATETFSGRRAPLDVHTHPRSRMFRTAIREAAALDPNFAGRYRISTWGCGAGCVSLAVIDLQRGKVFHPANLDHVDITNIAYDEFVAPNDELIQFQRDSRLLIVIGGINEDTAQRGISYFVWEKNRLRRVRFVHRPYR